MAIAQTPSYGEKEIDKIQQKGWQIAMKKTYETPNVEVVEFNYSDQVVAASVGKCVTQVTHAGESSCTSGGGTVFKHD